MHPYDVRVPQLGERPLLHIDLVEDVLMPPLEAVHLRLLDHLEGERLAAPSVLHLSVHAQQGGGG